MKKRKNKIEKEPEEDRISKTYFKYIDTDI